MKHNFLVPTLVSLMMLSENALAAVSGNCGARSGSGTTQDPYVYADTCQWTLDTETGVIHSQALGHLINQALKMSQLKME